MQVDSSVPLPEMCGNLLRSAPNSPWGPSFTVLLLLRMMMLLTITLLQRSYLVL